MAKKRFIHTNGEHQFDHKKGIVRRQIYVTRTADVPLAEFDAIITGINKIISETERDIQIVNYDNFNLGNGAYGTPEWYVNQVMTSKDKGFGSQASAYKLAHLLEHEPYQKQNPHFDFFVLNTDLTTQESDNQNNFLFGYGPYPVNIVSITRFMDWIPDADLRNAALAVLSAHEVGHNLDLVHRDFNIGTTGYEVGHCKGEIRPCLMEQVNVPGKRDIAEQALILLDYDNWLCPDCTREIKYKKRDMQSKGIHW